MKHTGSIPPPEVEEFKSARAFDSSREERMIRTAPGTLLILHAMLAILLQIAWTLVPDGTAGIDKKSLEGYVAAAALMQGLCILLPTLVIARMYRIHPRILLGRGFPRPGGIILAATAGVPAAVLLTGLNNLTVHYLLKSGFTPAVSTSLGIASDDTRAFAVMVVMAIVIPGIVEELMFRGLIQGAMVHSGARISAVLLPALAFALFHADPLFLIAPLGAGLLLGYLRMATDGLYAPIAAHITLNLTVMLIRPILPQWRDTLTSPGTVSSDALLATSVAAILVALVAFVPVVLAFGSTLFRRSTTAVQDPHQRSDRRVFLEWRFFVGCLLLAASLYLGYSFTMSLG